jgi:hypothetical protein
MTDFLSVAFGYPTAVFTALLCVVVVYWLLAIVGLVDFDHGHMEFHPHVDGDIGDIGTLAGFLVAMGLNGVPFSVVVSLVVLAAWTVCAMLATWLLPLVPTAVLTFAVGTAMLLGSLGVALPISAAAVRPLRKLFVTHNAISNATLVGQTCRIVTQTVDEKFGRAEVDGSGASINIRVWATTPNRLVKGSIARIVEYDDARACFLVAPEL